MFHSPCMMLQTAAALQPRTTRRCLPAPRGCRCLGSGRPRARPRARPRLRLMTAAGVPGGDGQQRMRTGTTRNWRACTHAAAGVAPGRGKAEGLAAAVTTGAVVTAAVAAGARAPVQSTLRFARVHLALRMQTTHMPMMCAAVAGGATGSRVGAWVAMRPVMVLSKALRAS